MKLYLYGHDYKYAAEQMLLTLFPAQRPEYPAGPPAPGEDALVLSLHRGAVWATATAALSYGGREYRAARRCRTAELTDPLSTDRALQRILKLAFYDAGTAARGGEPPWGALTGVRPVKIPTKAMLAGAGPAQAERLLRDTYRVTEGRRRLAMDCAGASLAALRSLAPGEVSLYVGIPFCPTRCAYCSFVSADVGRALKLIDPFLDALCRELAATGAMLADAGLRVRTVYFGGGTPSFYGEKRLREVLKTVAKRFDLAKDAEITVECNPDSVDKKVFQALRRAGVNRISLGVQSAHDCELNCLHRPHTFQQAQRAVAAAREAKIKNISLDLIYGLPNQDMAGWRDTVEQVLELEPEHLSCYGLKVEPGTPLDDRVVRGEKLPDDDQQADMYLWTVERLAAAGYRQYEISNFARAGFQSRHNLKYWMGRPYIGFGPGAHSDFGGRRYSFIRDLEGYIAAVLEGGTVIDESDLIPQRERGGEYLMLRLRTTRGIEEWEYRREFFMNFDPIEQKLEEYERQGWAERHDRRWNLTAKGFLVSNQLIGELLSIQEEATLEKTLPRLKQGRPEEG